jgi:acetyl esterase/lipase
VPADLHVYAGAPHGFDTMMAGTAVAQRAWRTLEAWLKPQLHPDR